MVALYQFSCKGVKKGAKGDWPACEFALSSNRTQKAPCSFYEGGAFSPHGDRERVFVGGLSPS